MVDEISVVNAIDADLDGLPPVRVFTLFADRGVDARVNIWLRMIWVKWLAFGEFGRKVQRLEMVIAPVHVALQFAGVQLPRAVPTSGSPPCRAGARRRGRALLIRRHARRVIGKIALSLNKKRTTGQLKLVPEQ